MKLGIKQKNMTEREMVGRYDNVNTNI